jgi:hypothetical protein
VSHGTLHGLIHGTGADLVIDQVQKALDRLYVQLEGSPKIEGLAEWIGEQLQHVEEIVHDTAWFRFTRQAHGEQLDRLLDNYSEKRAGMSDADAEAMLLVLNPALFQFRSAMRMIAILVVLTNGTGSTFGYDEDYPLAFVVTLHDVTTARGAHWNRVLRKAKAEGVRMDTVVAEDLANAFQFDIGPGFDQGKFAYVLE